MFLSSTPSNIFLESSFKSAKQRHFHTLFYSLNDWGLAAEFHYSCKVFRSSSVISPLYLFVACAYSLLQYAHSLSRATSCIFGMDGKSTGNNNTALVSLIFFQPLLPFLGNKGPDSPGSPNILLYLSQTLIRLASG